MEILLAFITGLAVGAAIVHFVYRNTIKTLEAGFDREREAIQTRFNETVAKFSTQVKADTEEILKLRQQEFTESSNKSIGQLVDPLKEKISELRKTMEDSNKEQADRNGEMRERLQNLMKYSEAARKSADELAAAFKHEVKMQGNWGETVLEEVLSKNGLTKGIHFDMQAFIMDANGEKVKNENDKKLQPDVILHLDEIREVIIDAKVSLSAYVRYVNAENEADKSVFLAEHIKSLENHVNELAKKDYSSYVKSPKVSAGYVIMFVPNMGALWTALNAKPELWRNAADRKVYICDEQSLYGALKVVSATWTQIVQAQNHEKVYELADEMIKRVGVFIESYGKIGIAINNAAKAYNEGNKKLDNQGQSIIHTSNKLIQLGAKNDSNHPLKEIVDIDEIPVILNDR